MDEILSEEAASLCNVSTLRQCMRFGFILYEKSALIKAFVKNVLTVLPLQRP